MDQRTTIKDEKPASRRGRLATFVCAVVCGTATLIAARNQIIWPIPLSADQLPLLLTAATLLATTAGIVMMERSATKQLAATKALHDVMARVLDAFVEIAKSTESTTGLHEVMKAQNVDAAAARRHFRAVNSEKEFAAFVVCSLLSMALTRLHAVPSASRR